MSDQCSHRATITALTSFLLLLVTPPEMLAEDVAEAADAEPLTISGLYTVRPSESPHLRPPHELKDATPIAPYDGPPGPPVADPTATITHSLASGETFVVPSPATVRLPVTDEPRTLGPFAGLALPVATSGAAVGSKSILGSDGRTRVTGTGIYPWRTVVRLGVRWTPGGGLGACSGALISDYHVLTAGHCVFDYDGTNDWAYSIKVFPGLDDDEIPYNYAWATRIHSYTGWTNSGMSEHDWAVIALDRSIGSFTGWMGRLTTSSSSSVYTDILNTAGYPGTPSGDATCPTWANCQYWDSDNGHSADNYNHWYWMDTSGGMSGGPVWRYLSSTDERHIVTAHTCGTGGCGISGNGVNHGTRLNNDKFDRVASWISADSDITPNDRADLIDDGQAFSGFSPTSVYNGQSFSAWSDVRNIGTATSGSFHVSYFASTNTTITTSDHLIGHDLTGSISPFTWTDSHLNLNFPSGIPDGTYYLGWIIDRFGNVSEFDEGNNSAYKTSYQLSVCNKASTPSLLAPADGAQTADQTPTFDWTDASAASSYRIQVDDASNFSSPLINTNTAASAYTPPSNLTYDKYYWRVRADKSCGTIGDWSAAHSIVISPPSSSCDLHQVSNSTIGGIVTHGACREMRAGPSLTVTGTGRVTLEAGSSVVLYDGFRVETGGTLRVQTCGNNLCTTGSALNENCHTCVKSICAAEPSCCTSGWDSACVEKVASICGLSCT